MIWVTLNSMPPFEVALLGMSMRPIVMHDEVIAPIRHDDAGASALHSLLRVNTRSGCSTIEPAATYGCLYPSLRQASGIAIETYGPPRSER